MDQMILVPNKDGSVFEMEVPFIGAVHYTKIETERKIDRIVLHCTENQELPNMARMNANLFASSKSPKASFHYVVDDREIIQSVHDVDVAWHAPGANHNGIGIEIVGRANQDATMWADEYSRSALYRTMGLCAHLCRWYGIPPVFLNSIGLLVPNAPGITTHACVSNAFPKNSSGHWDPGPNFPIDALLNGIRTMLMVLENRVVEAVD